MKPALLLLLLLGCDTVDRRRPDGAVEYLFNDTWVAAGDSCDCFEMGGDSLVIERGRQSRVVLDCMPRPSECRGDDGGCNICIGSRCCVWTCPQQGCE